MTDRELLELAAKAAGIYYKHDNKDWKHGDYCAFRSYDDLCTCGGRWNPLDDDGDALRLAVTVAKKWRGLWLKMQVDSIESVDRTSVSVTGLRYCYSEEWGDEGDPLAATRLAIVRAAAEIGRNMK